MCAACACGSGCNVRVVEQGARYGDVSLPAFAVYFVEMAEVQENCRTQLVGTYTASCRTSDTVKEAVVRMPGRSTAARQVQSAPGPA